MRPKATATLIAILATQLSTALASPLPQVPNAPILPILNLPTTSIACVTSAESSIWTVAQITSLLSFSSSSGAATQYQYLAWGIQSDVASAPGASDPFPSAPTSSANFIGPNPNMEPIFPASCNTKEVLYYAQLVPSEGHVNPLDDVVVYGVDTTGAGAIEYCGVLTTSDNPGQNGYHQCNKV